MKPIRVIFFDLDDTLIFEEPMIAAAFARTCAAAAVRHGVDPAALEQSVRRIARERWYAAQGEELWGHKIGISSWEVLYGDFAVGDAPLLRWLRENARTFRQQAWASALREQGVEDEPLAHALAERFRDIVYANVTLFPETIEVLNALRSRYRLGMITNGAPDVQRGKVIAANLQDYFEAIIISGELGIGKPERGIFDHALRVMSAVPEDSLMVGNSFERDVEGALGAGMRAVWLNLLHAPPPRNDARCETIYNLRELLSLVCGSSHDESGGAWGHQR
ncbi:MAG: HAD family hydrolase [Abditibacteriales bacterium]|nr:HAD family hydrolase [Abditibacteriales bacterium]MDW8365234.1 HAD family hydrolase [Abditibacteriales bacterium]